MKKLLLVLVILTGIGFADDNQEEMITVTVPKSSLTPQQQATAKQQEVKGWVGVGKEIGDAVNSSLQAVTTQSNNFAQTKVGKLTVVVVIWKLIGADLVHIGIGMVFPFVVTPFWVWSYRRMCLPHRVIISETISPDKTKTRTWKVVNDSRSDEVDGWTLGHWLGAALIIVITLVTIFSF